MLKVVRFNSPAIVPLFNVMVGTSGWFRRYKFAYREINDGVLSEQKVLFIYKIVRRKN